MKYMEKDVNIISLIQVPILRTCAKLELRHGLEKAHELIMSPYFLGYIQGFASSLVILSFGPQFAMDRQKIVIKVQEILRAVFDHEILRTIFGDASGIALTLMVEFQKQRNADFIKGYENGGITGFIEDILDNEHLPSVVSKAQQLLREKGVNPDDINYISKLVDMLHDLLLLDYFGPPKWFGK